MTVFIRLFLDKQDVDDTFTRMDELIQHLPAAATSIQVAWGVLLAISVLTLTWLSLKLVTNVLKVAALAVVVYGLTTPVPDLQAQVDQALTQSRITISEWLQTQDDALPSMADIASDQLLAREERPQPQGLDISK